MTRVVALAGRFRHDGELDELAARFGAVSAQAGLTYWSTTEQAWRPLISEAAALSAADPDARRPDFGADDVRSGETLYFTQNDTRSSGMNVYRLTALDPGTAASERMVIEVVNESAIGVVFVTFFDPEALLTLHVIERLEGDVWGYYSLTAIRAGSTAGNERSLINRAAAFYRFIRGLPGDAAPPLAR